jgi:hypothetical protein
VDPTAAPTEDAAPPSSTPTATPGPADAPDAQAVRGVDDDSGVPLGLLAGGLLVAALGGAGARQALVRRRESGTA